MIEVIAQGPQPGQRWRNRLHPGRTMVIGRGADADWPVPWDNQISRRHVELRQELDEVYVSRLIGSRNPLFVSGAEVETARLRVGQHLVLGETVITFAKAESEAAAQPQATVEVVAFTARELRKVRYQDPENRIEVLTHLPEVIAGARDDGELQHRLANLLLRGIVHADAIGLVSLTPEGEVRMLYWDRRRETAGEFRPSRRLVAQSLGEKQSSVMHVWES
ncbi:MAG TPA: FHA domain-containing protein [Planctomycetaceae bacterium]|nr:FHA domain-containing protein [Planctomycetaceae bacterium]